MEVQEDEDEDGTRLRERKQQKECGLSVTGERCDRACPCLTTQQLCHLKTTLLGTGTVLTPVLA